MMKQTLRIQNLSIPTKIGVHAWEKEISQTLIINLELQVDVSAALVSDNVNDTLDYTSLASRITETCLKKHYDLVEHLAHEILLMLKNTSSKILTCKVTITKNNVLPNCDSIQFELED